MLMSPRRVKHRKMHRGRMTGMAMRGNQVAFGEFGLKAMEPGTLNSRQMEAIRIAITRTVKKGGKIWFRIFPDFPYTKKPAETRMGKGKGEPEEWRARILPGRVIVELGGVDAELAKEALEKAAYKIGIKTKIVERLSF
ncbi:MAG TPA: 50S ribosomal protein L16 [Spirochaetia bacterium]|nr:MAG: 50S ribosomal protein L16 [Spirochaetes bacterium GWB1_36_13]HCL57333.1 50S ribosomal protein L16 [Spirochaetia bacterium]